MEHGARDSREHGPSSSSAARRLAEATLLRTMERVTAANDETMRPAVHSFVEVLVKEGATPEAAVIALKETFARAHELYRFEPLVREQMRSAWVSECIDHYFSTRRADDASTRREAGGGQSRERANPGDAGAPPDR